MAIKDTRIIKLEDLDKLRSAPILNQEQSKILINQVVPIILNADWLTIGIMSPTLIKGLDSVRQIEKKFNFNKMKCVTLPSSDGPIYLKANQKTSEIHARIEYGLGEGILISCHNNDDEILSRTIGPFPLDFFN
tara:strand:- start:729 stop:1130 length:402 start_codon:yes stop_codon:yes gene_type:complete